MVMQYRTSYFMSNSNNNTNTEIQLFTDIVNDYKETGTISLINLADRKSVV